MSTFSGELQASKQASADLIVAKQDLKLATAIGDNETAKIIAEKLPELEKQNASSLKNLGTQPQEAPRTIGVSEGDKKFYTTEQQIEILADSDYRKIVQNYKDPADQEKAIEIISILKNHNKEKLSKSEIIKEFDRYLKQCE